MDSSRRSLEMATLLLMKLDCGMGLFVVTELIRRLGRDDFDGSRSFAI